MTQLNSPMSTMNSHASTGRTVGRFLRSLGLSGGDPNAAQAYAESQQRIDKGARADVFKAGVSAVDTSDMPSGALRTDFMEALRPYAVLSRLTKIRQVPARTKIIAFGAGTIAYRVGQHKNIPISKPELLGISIDPAPKVAALTVATKEALATPGMSIEIALANDVAKAVGAAEDLSFLNPVEPGSILNGAPTALSLGTDVNGVTADLLAAFDLLNAAGGKLQDAAWVMSPSAAGKLAALRGDGGAAAFPDIGPNGGDLLKLPVVVSESADGYLALIDQAGVIVDEDAGVKISLSENAMLQMTDDPTDPPDAPTLMVSIFQTECVAFKAVSYRTWKSRGGAGVYITGGLW